MCERDYCHRVGHMSIMAMDTTISSIENYYRRKFILSLLINIDCLYK